jgi:membrane protein YqaA with SNARE-associated domain
LHRRLLEDVAPLDVSAASLFPRDMKTIAIALVPWLAKMGELLRALVGSLDGPGLLLIALFDSSFLSIPEGNDLLIVLMSAGNTWKNMAYYVGMTTVGSIAGCLLLYTVGRKGGSPLLHKRFSEKNVRWAERLFERYGMLTVVLPSILPPPCPFKIFVLSAGVFRLRLVEFVAAIAIGRTVRYSMWGVLALLYGNSVKVFMQRNLFYVGIALFALLLLALASIVVYRLKFAGRPEELPDSNS